MATEVDAISAALAAQGLITRGGFTFLGAEDRPEGPDGRPARAVLLVGNAGSDFWPLFQAWRQSRPPGLPDPLDTWSRQVAGTVADRFGARLVMPNDRPYAPFQQWAMRAEGLLPSPLGLLIHPVHGPWHAYRAALLFDREIDFPPVPAADHPCASCRDRPCLTACPVGAFRLDGFDAAGCRAHATGPAGAPCRETGCLARNACPVGTGHRQVSEQQAFHMAAFLGAR